MYDYGGKVYREIYCSFNIMVSKTIFAIWIVWEFFWVGVLVLIGLYPTDIKELIASIFGFSNKEVVFYALFILAIIAISTSIIIIVINLIKKNEVIIQKDSLRFNKYPYLVKSKSRVQHMTNMVYAEITVENSGKTKVECEVEISLKNNGIPYKSKVVSADSTTKPNPMSISVDANGGEMGFYPLCIRLDTLETFLPNHPLGGARAFSGTPVGDGEYEIFGKVIYGQKQSKMVSLGKIKIPDDFLNNAIIPNDIQVTIDKGGFAVYLVSHREKMRAEFYGNNNDDDIKSIILNHLEKISQIDEVIDDNGKSRQWEIITEILNGGRKRVNLIDL